MQSLTPARIISIALIVVAVAMFYWLVIFLPGKEHARQQFEQQQAIEKRAVACRELAATDYQKRKNESIFINFLSVEYSYNPKLNLCLYRADYVIHALSQSGRLIKDVYTNQELANYVESSSEAKREDFEQEYRMLFNK